MTARDQRLVFRGAVEGLLRVLGAETERPDLKKALCALGVDPSNLLPAYDLETCQRLLEFVGERRFPSVTGDERQRELGRAFIRCFSETFMGKAAMAMGRILGPSRATQRLTRAMRMTNNYSTSGASHLTQNSMALWCEPVANPWYYVGIFEEGGKTLHGPSYTVELKAFDRSTERAEFLVHW